ncbi:MAG TPA: glycosyltransferase family 39 protein, partial [Terriglobia bacterium]|nr:glycosyltransferase family 39 protein [Terriglobia bacterium]
MGWAKDSVLTKEASNVGIAIGVIALLQAAVLSLGFTSLTTDEYTRTLYAASWAKTHLLPTDEWLPGHIWILGTALKIRYDLFLTPRIVTYLFSLQCLLALYLLARYLFNRWVALISICILGSLQIYVYLSLTPLVDMVYYTFLLWFLYFLLRWLEQRQPAPFFAAALMLGFATTLRYEAWFIAALFSVYLLVRSIAELQRSRVAGTLIALAVVWIVPCLWLAGNYIWHGDPLQIMGAYGGWIRFRLETESISNWAALLFRTGSHICVLGLAGIWLSRSIVAREKLCLYLGLTFAPLVVLSVFTTGPGNVYAERYVGQYLLPLIPFCAHAVYCALIADRHRSPIGQLPSWPALAIFSIYNLWLVYLKMSGHGGRLISLLTLAGISLSWRLLELRRWMLLAATLSPLALFIVLPRTRFALISSDAHLRLYFVVLLTFYGLYLLRAKYSPEHRATARFSARQWWSLGAGLLSIVLFYGLWGTFVDHPDFFHEAPRAGLHVRRLFDERILREDTKVLMQVSDWDFIVIPTMSNRPHNFMFDRYPYKKVAVPAAD